MATEEQKDITSENVFDVKVAKLAMDSRFGSLVFDKANEKLSKAQGWLKEAHDLGYKDLLLRSEAGQVESLINQLAEHLQWLRKFDIGAVPNAKQEHDAFETRVDGFYDTVYRQIVMVILTFLREERRRENPNQQQTDEEVKKVVQIRTDLENELKKVREETEKLRIAGKEVGSAKGERAAVRLASHFDTEAGNYQTKASRWFIVVITGYTLLLCTLAFLGWLTVSYFGQIFSLPETAPNLGIIWSAGIAKLVVIAALWYGLSFVVKNYNVNSHLAAVNRHRAAVARTLEDFIAVEEQQETPRLSEMLQNATGAMFKHAPIGFVSKTEKESSAPVLQVVNDLMGIKNQT